MIRCILLAVTIFASTSASPIPDVDDIGIDVNKTLENVRDILEANPLLPRLSEAEILSLLNTITAEDKLKQSEEDLSSNETKDEEDKEEKIMVVYPYQPDKDEDGDIAELFTKPPIVKYVSSVPSRDREDLTTEVPKKKTNVPKKASSFKTGESKDLMNQKKNEFPPLIADTIVFNNEFSDQHPVETSAFPDISAYDNFKSMPQNEQAIPEHIKTILKQIEDEAITRALKQKDAEETSSSNDEKFEYVDSDTFPEEMTSLLTDLGLMKTNGDSVKSKGRKVEESHSQLSTGIDPLSLEEVTVDDTIGNELKKRQQENVTEVVKATIEENKKTEKEESTEKNTLADLENSFGGSSADDDPSEAELPPPRRNGFYYMLDWNSFLEVGDGDEKVNIRFDPKLGDPQRFIAVSVP